MPIRLGIVSDRFAQPLFDLLREEKKFLLLEGSPSELAIKLRQRELDGAFLSPIDYAKDYSVYRLLPEVAAVSQRESGAILLVFKEDTQTIKSMGVNPAYESEIVLASVIFAEKYETRLQIIPTRAGIECLRQNTDAFLACGDEAVKFGGYRNKIDLVDEWQDISDLPYVHGFWVIREGAVEREDIDIIIRAGKEGTKRFGGAEKPDSSFESALFSCSFGDNEIHAVNEFFRMAFYHGIIKDIPEVRFA